MMDSHLPGIAAGLFLATIVGYALLLYLKPLRGKNSGIGIAFTFLAILWTVKTVALHWLLPPMPCPVVIPDSPAITPGQVHGTHSSFDF
jgi:hypothetical protein